MRIPRDLYYIIDQKGFRNVPWRRERSVEESLERVIRKEMPFDLTAPGRYVGTPGPLNYRESSIAFGTPSGCGHRDEIESWDEIEFKPFAYHAGNEQPLRIDEAKKRKEDGEDLEFMHIPIGRMHIPFGENFHTLTDREFESVVGKVRKPVRLTWETWDRSVDHSFTSYAPGARATPLLAQKVELLQECMVGVRIIDSGSRSKREAVQTLSRLLDHRRFFTSENDKDFYWVNWHPLAYMHDSPGPRQETSTTVIQISNDANDIEAEYQTVELRAMAAHEGDRQPIPVAKAKVLNEEGESTNLMQVPLGYIHWVPREKRPINAPNSGLWEQPVEWTWTEDWEEPAEWVWADGWEKPIELTWGNVSGFENGHRKSVFQKIIFLRHYLKMIYIVDSGEELKGDVVAAIEDLTGIELRHSTNSYGQDYWWKVQYDGSSTKPSSPPTGSTSNSDVPSVLDLYGGDKERAHDHYWNTN